MFEPPDAEEDREAMMEAWFDQQEKNGMVVASREELRDRIDRECTDAYAEGRADQYREDKGLMAWAYSKLIYRSFDNMDDALQMDRIKLLIEHGIRD
jgi:hypothetical protein